MRYEIKKSSQYETLAGTSFLMWTLSKMIDGSEKRKRQLAFELQNSCVYEKHNIT